MPDIKTIQRKVSKLSSTDSGRRKRAVLALKEFSGDQTNHQAICEAGGIEALVRLVADDAPAPKTIAVRWSGDLKPEIRSHATEALLKLALYINNDAAIRDAGGVLQIIKLLDAPDKEIQIKARDALLYLGRNIKNAEAIRDAGGMPLLLTLCSDQSEMIRGYAVCGVRNMEQHAEGMTRIIEYKGIPVLVRLLADNSSNTREDAVYILRKIANEGKQPEIIQKSACMPFLLPLLHDENTAIKQNALLTMLALIIHDDQVMLALKAEDLRSVMSLLTDKLEQVRRHAASFLRYAFEFEKHKAFSREANTVAAFVHLLQDRDIATRKTAVLTLASLTESTVAIRKAGGIPVLMEICVDVYDDLKISAIHLLKAMSTEAESARLIVASHGVAKLLELIDGGDFGLFSSDEVTESAAVILKQIAQHQDNHLAFHDKGDMASLVALLGNESRQRVKKELFITFTLLTKNKANHIAIRDVDGLQVLLSLLNDRGDTTQNIKRYAVKALNHLLGTIETHQAFRASQGIATCIALLSDADSEVKQNAVALLKTLATNVDNHVAIQDVTINDTLLKEYVNSILSHACTNTRASQSSGTSSSSGSSVASPQKETSSLPVIPWGDIDAGHELGRGSFGVVKAGRWHGSTPVALKQLNGIGLSEASMREFRDEANVHGRLRHPNIVMLYGICAEAGRCALVLELMKGSLRKLLNTDRIHLGLTQHIRLATHIATGLQYLHSQDILHRDLKSENVLIDEHGVAKLSDFGLSGTSQTGAGAGSPLWMAPELLNHFGTHTVASDIYALGVVLCELVSRKIPFHYHDNALQLIAGGQRDTAIIPLETAPKFKQLIERCWAQRVDDRPSSARAVMDELSQPVEQFYDKPATLLESACV